MTPTIPCILFFSKVNINLHSEKFFRRGDLQEKGHTPHFCTGWSSCTSWTVEIQRVQKSNNGRVCSIYQKNLNFIVLLLHRISTIQTLSKIFLPFLHHLIERELLPITKSYVLALANVFFRSGNMQNLKSVVFLEKHIFFKMRKIKDSQ
jgi:hypothetical protein